MYPVKVVADCPTPYKIAEKIAAKAEGTKNWNSVPLESITPSLFIALFNLIWPKAQINPVAVPIAKAAPGL